MRNNKPLGRFLQVLLTNTEFAGISDIVVKLECRTCRLLTIQRLSARDALTEFAYMHRNHKIFFETELTRT
ncbi:MAG: hypothetical protein QXS68_07105 [Candidatus Methanomethylicaceae archaeon]